MDVSLFLERCLRSRRSKRVETNELLTLQRYFQMKLACFNQLGDHERYGVCRPGSFNNCQHGHFVVTLAAPENWPTTAPADDQKTVSLDSDFSSFLHRGVWNVSYQ
jgi:hypothetical protein